MEIFLSILDIIESNLSNILPVVFKFVEDWWWLPALLVFFDFWKHQYKFYINGKWDSVRPSVLLEIKVPQEVERPIKAMENVFNNLWSVYDAPNWKEKWIEGQFLIGFSFEIVGINREPHFYIRTRKAHKTLVESTVYSQYPDAEVTEVDDYTKGVPADIPNKDWNLFGTSMKLGREDFYPIVTYKKFFEEDIKTPEEKRMDPLSSLLDGIATLSPDEQIWIQIVTTPILITGPDAERALEKEAKKTINKMMKRKEAPKQKPILQEAAQILFFGQPTVEKKEERVAASELELTPGERDVIKSIEEKIYKHAFNCHIRFMYLGKRNVFVKAVSRIPFGYFIGFTNQNLNMFRVLKDTLTKVTYFFKKRRIYLKSRKLFRHYKFRTNPSFPERTKGEIFVLNSEELATMWHLPSKIGAPAPTLARVAAKKSVAPPNLPIEE